MNIDTTNAQITPEQLLGYKEKLTSEITAMNEASEKEYEDPRSSINLPFDSKHLSHIKKTASKYRCDTLIVVGIGGSNLGTVAVHEALHTKLHNELGSTTVYFADTVDSRRLEQLRTIIQDEKESDNRVVINAVSKSGGTTETIANFEYLTTELDSDEDVIITTSKGSAFDTYAAKHSIETLYIPEMVGGRYSVFSAVGLLPLAVLNVDIDALLEGARAARNAGLQPFSNNPAAKSAAIHHHHYLQNRNISNMFLFSPDLESLGKWYRQLMGESLGKEFNKDNTETVNAGITPTVSVGSTDLHSVAQLYLGGPDDTYHEFVTVNHEEVRLPKRPEFETLVEDIQGKAFSDIMDAILQGTQGAFKKRGRPYSTVTLPGLDERSLGEFLQMKMMEMMFLGHLLDVNPFDQPNVESYKKITKELLKQQ